MSVHEDRFVPAAKCVFEFHDQGDPSSTFVVLAYGWEYRKALDMAEEVVANPVCDNVWELDEYRAQELLSCGLYEIYEPW